ncbi:IclR family transcriptional regulator [Parapusillimonas sp. SGNA-6]|nr:IclR family transcriptional regulator [Parapusillimonas sp. SGNA-6]
MENRLGIKSIEVGGRLLKELARLHAPISLKELAEKARLTPSAAHHYLVSYRRLGLVRQEPDTLGYTIGPFAVELGMAAIGQSKGLVAAQLLLEKVRNRIDESALLATWGSYGPVIISIAESSQPIIMTMRIGATMPLLQSATGLIFAAFMPQAIIGPVIQREFQEGRILSEYRTRSALTQKLEAIRQARLVGHSGHLLPGIAAVATPLIGPRNELVAAITVFGSAGHFDNSLEGAPAEILKEAGMSYMSMIAGGC